MILLDTSALLAALDDRQRHHHACLSALERDEGPFLLSPFVLAELDYLLSDRYGVEVELALLTDVTAGAYRLESFAPSDVKAAVKVIERYRDAEVGLADASLVVLSDRHRCLDVLTLDERHFRALRGARGKSFRLLPADIP